MENKSAFHQTYVRAAGALCFVAIVDKNGDDGIGSAFHIGEGIFVTARHVVDGVTIKEIATTKSARLADEGQGKEAAPRRLTMLDGPHFGPDGLDVAVFRVDLGKMPLPAIAVSQHTDYSLGENDLVLSDVLIVGYPPIPFTTVPTQVVSLGQINAVVRVRHSPALHFIASTMARGGFSGGVALDQSGMALALVTESLGEGGKPAESGYMSLLSIEPAVDLAASKYKFSAHGGYPGRYTDTLYAVRFSDPFSKSLNSLIYDASLYVHDDNRDVFIEIVCSDESLLAEAVAHFNNVTPLTRHDVVDGSVVYTPKYNPPPEILVQGGEAVADVFERAGYQRMASERSQWQLDRKW